MGKVSWLESLRQIEAFEDADFDAALVAEMERAAPASRQRLVRFSTPTFKEYESSEQQSCGKNSFPAFSITAGGCALMCDHCEARILEPMIPAIKPGGKSLAYNIPVLESILADRNTQALYIFPLKGLEQDQVRNVNELSDAIGLGPVGEVYDGDTPPKKRQEIRENLPNVIFTNPDMVHLAFLPFHRKWEDLFRNLKYIVIDEIHTYPGVFGSNVSQIMRRLRRVCLHYGSFPQFISASATISNPGRLAEDLTGVPFRVIDESGAPSAGRHFYFMNPIESPYTLATKLFVQCMRAGLRTIVFSKARKITELIHTWASGYAPVLRYKISPYRAGILPNERSENE